MARSKRPISPEAGPSNSSKRARIQPTPKDVIVIDDDDDNSPPPPPQRRSKRRAPSPPANDSDIEVLEDPPDASATKKSKGKGKAASSSTPAPRARRAKRVVHDVEALAAQAEALEKDEEMARRIAREWAAADSPEPDTIAGPSSSKSKTTAAPPPSGSRSEVISVDDDINDGIEVLSNGASSKGRRNSSSVPAVPSTEAPKRAQLDLPSITLRNPNQVLGEIKTLLTSSLSCTKCGELIDAPHTTDFKLAVGDPDATLAGLRSILHFACPGSGCGEVYCRGCLKPVSCPGGKCAGSAIAPGDCQILQCCAEIRAVALYEVLGAFDRQYLEDKASAEARTKESVKNQKKSNIRTVGPGGTGYATEGGGVLLGGSGLLGGGFEEEDEEGWDSELEDYMDDDGLDDDDVEDHFGMVVQEYAFHQVMPHHRGVPIQAPEPEVEPELSQSDKTLMQALAILTDLLPAPYSDEPAIYDLLPHPSLGGLLLMSFVPSVLADLLRNDSVTDWIARHQVYHAMLTLLKRMGDGELTVPLLVGRRPEFSKTCSIDSWMWGEGQFSWTRNEDGDVSMAPPLLEHFKKLTRQAETFLQTTRAQFRGTNGESNDPTFVIGVSLCSDIVGAQDDIRRAMEAMHQALSSAMDVDEDVQETYGRAVDTNDAAEPSTSTRSSKRGKKAAAPKAAKAKGKGKAQAPAVEKASFDLEKEYIEACEKLSFEYVSFPTAPGATSSAQIYQSYKFAPELQQTQNATRIPKARLHFAKELAVMATSLPPGIWVRIDEVRNDAIKVMIAGPQGTPYAGGLFEFDCFIPLEYPNRPPLMHLRTTGGGSVRFNPNLYNCGKVCLSLLGTWSGTPEEQWTSKSTLLQVLVSIQSMILNEAPYYNEPGHGVANLKAKASIDYNRDVSFNTVRWAMVDWLKDEHRTGIWKDVIKSHFTLRKEKTRQQIAAWAKEDGRIESYSTRPQAHPRPAPIKAAKGKAGGGHDPFSNLRLPPAPTVSKPAINLAHEFEEGMRRVEAW